MAKAMKNGNLIKQEFLNYTSHSMCPKAVEGLLIEGQQKMPVSRKLKSPHPTPHPHPCWVYWLPHLVILFSFIGTHKFLFAIQIVDLMFNLPIEIRISNSLVFKGLWQLNSPVSCSPKSFALLLKKSFSSPVHFI